MFILIVLIFFIIIASSIYFIAKNKATNQEVDTTKIEQEYNRSVDNMDEIYEEQLEKENNVTIQE